MRVLIFILSLVFVSGCMEFGVKMKERDLASTQPVLVTPSPSPVVPQLERAFARLDVYCDLATDSRNAVCLRLDPKNQTRCPICASGRSSLTGVQPTPTPTSTGTSMQTGRVCVLNQNLGGTTCTDSGSCVICDRRARTSRECLVIERCCLVPRTNEAGVTQECENNGNREDDQICLFLNADAFHFEGEDKGPLCTDAMDEISGSEQIIDIFEF